MYRRELRHYGVKGMKWGVRRYQDKNGRLTSAGKKRYSTNSKNNDEATPEEQQKRGLTDKQKKILKVGAIAAGTALAAYGTYKLYGAYTGKGQAVDPTTGFRMLNKDMTDAEHLKTINPGRIKLFSTKYKNKEIIEGSSSNCMLCTTAWELRKRGYDVHAGYSKNGFTPAQLFPLLYDDYNGTSKVSPLTQRGDTKACHDLASRIISNLKEQGGPGSRGNIMVYWDGDLGGHSMIWENRDGKFSFFDGQTGQQYKSFAEEILKYTSTSKPVEILRTDNLKLTDDKTFLNMFVNKDTSFKTYVDHGAEITKNLVGDERVQAAALAAGYVGVKGYYAAQNRKQTKATQTGKNKQGG